MRMPDSVNFLLVALAIHAWDCMRWLPVRAPALKKRLFRRSWRTVDPRAMFSIKGKGAVMVSPWRPEFHFAPCQALPVMVGADGAFFIDQGDAEWRACEGVPSLDVQDQHVRVGGLAVPTSSVATVAPLLGRPPEALEEAVRDEWRRSLSVRRARRTWQWWRLAADGFAWSVPFLAPGFFLALPAYYFFLGAKAALLLAGGLWLLMVATAFRLWWLAGRLGNPSGRSLRMDSVLAMIVPFHAMRAVEEGAVPVMARTHPAAFLLAHRPHDSPWLGMFVRRLLHPRPGVKGDQALADLVLPQLKDETSRLGLDCARWDVPPIRRAGLDGDRYCPRCHSLYRKSARTCEDCLGLPLRDMPEA